VSAAHGSSADTQGPDSSRSGLPLVLAGLGGAAAIAGVVLIFAGSSKIPAKCDYFSKECTAPPKDPAYDEAKSGAGMINAGIGFTAGGVVALGTGLIWYFAQSTGRSAAHLTPGVAPWVNRGTGGLSFRSAF